MTGLIELDGFTTERWTGTVLPAVYTGTATCGQCSAGTTVTLPTVTNVPLFRHGGYGEATRIAAVVCLACGSTRIVTAESQRPQIRRKRGGT